MIEKRTNATAGRRPGSAWWLIVKDENGRTEVLTIGEGGEEALALFSHVEEAEMYLWLARIGDGWRAKETSAGELASVLYGICASARSVALDPLPGMVTDGTVGLVGLGRHRFLERILASERLAVP